MHQFSIITPTYNRAKYLPKIYDCLHQQDNIDLEWIIIDDGSTDYTKELVCGFKETFEIKYKYQENAGKPTAMNVGIQLANSYITLITLDSEDILCPNILKTVWRYFDIDTGNFTHDCSCLFGLCQYENGNIIGMKFPGDFFVSDYIKYVKNRGIVGDKCEFYTTKIIKKYLFPILSNEKNIAPSIIPIRIALSHKTLFVNQIFQEKKFLKGGLSTQNYWFMYPLGSELYHNQASIPPFKFKLQIKHSGHYIFFARMNHKKNIFQEANNKIIFPLGIFMYLILLFKYFLKSFHLFQSVNDNIKKKLNKKKQKLYTDS